jgi:sugar lactone lactonase YvrE
MRKALLVLILLLVAGAIAFFVFRLMRKPAPTPIAWHAHVTTLAGDGSPQFFSDPFGVAAAKDGTIYISDAGDTDRVRKISPKGTVTTLDGAFNTPSALALDDNGNLYVADTSNNRIRKITPEGSVSTVAGDSAPGYVDGPAASARFNGPVGVAVDAQGNVFVADTYNDRIRLISPDGQVSTVAGAGTPGFADGNRNTSLFDTPCGIAVATDGALIVADTGNDRLRRITKDGNVSTLNATLNGENVSSPIGLALTHDNFLYVTELDRSRVIQVAPDGSAHVIAGTGPGFANGSDNTRFNRPTGVAIDPRNGDLYVADSANYLVRKLSQTNRGDGNTTAASGDAGNVNAASGTAENITAPSGATATPNGNAAAARSMRPDPVPRLTNETLKQQSLIWPIDPQDRPHEVVATVGEVRGSFDSTDSRDHLHSGLDVFGAYGDTVRAIRAEKVTSPLANWGFESLNEGFQVGVISYIHLRVGRDVNGKMFDDERFAPIYGADGKLARVRIKRGARFNPGDALGTVNRMYHVHLIVGPSGGEINPLSLSPVGFKDDIPPTIEKNGVQLFDQSGTQFTQKQNGRLEVTGRVRIVVDAFDRTNFNADRRRLGLYRAGYQLLKPDGTPAPGFEQPRINILFNRLPPDRDSTKIAYADQSGITVYGSASTRFLYEVTNLVRDGHAETGTWDTSQLSPGDYILRIIAADYSGNEAQENRDLLLTIR